MLEGLPPELSQGLFARPAAYPVVMRFSTNPGDILDDSVSTPRGLAIKIVGLDGPRLLGTEDDLTQDFVMVNGPAFLKKDGKSFLSSLKVLAATTDRAPGLKKVLSAVLRGAEQVVEAAGAKRIQLCTDLDAMPIENSKVVWPEDRSPYRPVARIRVTRQSGWSEARSQLVDDRYSFSPWHGLAAHRPLGSVNRLRKQAYEMSRRFRATHNRVQAEEPRSLDRFPD